MFACALNVLGCHIDVKCADDQSFQLLRECYSAFLTDSIPASKSRLTFNIAPSRDENGWILSKEEERVYCRDSADLLYDFEKIATMQLQYMRDDLFFVHAAVLSIADQCIVVSGASGSGKSTLTWHLSSIGFRYLSDELAPVHPGKIQVEPYPHALCLKSVPDCEPRLPESTIYTSTTIHVPAYELPCHPKDQACPMEIIVFVDASRNGRDLRMATISSGEASARLYSNGLNQLAHIDNGLPAAASIAGRVSSYLLSGGTVEQRCQALADLI